MKKQNSSNVGFVYAFRNPLFSQWIKIGKAKDWVKRLKTCQTYSPLDFEPIATLKTSNMTKIERIIHNLLQCKEVYKKEFFCIDSDVAIDVLKCVSRQCGELSGLVLYTDGIPSECYTPNGEKVSTAPAIKLNGVIFSSAIKSKHKVKMTYKNERYVVLKGSTFYPMTDSLKSSENSAIASIRTTRESIENDPTLFADGILLADIPFKSSSRALAVMLGYSSVQGPAYWVDDEGTPLATYLCNS